MQFNYTPLVAGQFNRTTNIVSAYIVYELDNRARNCLSNFTLKNCFFGATNIVKNSDKEKHVYRGYGIAFDGKGEWSFNDYTARNVIIFRIQYSVSCYNIWGIIIVDHLILTMLKTTF